MSQKTNKLVACHNILDHFFESAELYKRDYGVLLENDDGFSPTELEAVLAKYRGMLLSQVVARVESGPTEPGRPLEPKHFRIFLGKDPNSDDLVAQERLVRGGMAFVAGEVISLDQDGEVIAEVRQALMTLSPTDIREKTIHHRQKQALDWFCSLVLTEAYKRTRAAA